MSKILYNVSAVLLAISFASVSSVTGAWSTSNDTVQESMRVKAETMCPPQPQIEQNLSKLTDSQLKEQANAAFWNDMYNPARDAIAELLKRAKCSGKKITHECFELEMNYAICDLQQGRLKEAHSRLIKLYPTVKAHSSNGGMDDPDCRFYLAECDYREGKYKNAIELYSEALALYRKLLPHLSPDLAPALEGLAGCYYRKRDYQLVQPLYKELAKMDLTTRGPNDLRFAWSLMNLSDVARRLHRDDESRVYFEAAVNVFRKVNQDRILARLQKPAGDETALKPDLLTLKSRLQMSVFGKENDNDQMVSRDQAIKMLGSDLSSAEKNEYVKRPLDFYNWRFKRSQKVEAPGFVIVNPEVPLKGLIICVHGLGLHHKSYADFGNKVSELGYGIVSFDMRGFGQYQDEKGFDLVDLDGCVDDLQAVIKLFKRDYPTTPIFLLGESMGGAIALHVAAKCQDDLDGLISSVPSGKRYKAKKAAFGVAVRLLESKDKQFNIGSQVINQATHNETLRKEWHDDPDVRLNLSAVELVKFQRFMNQNQKLAKELKTLPVIIFQGFGDKLVKPEGTLALYNAMGTKYKNLVLIGHQEHLIFEEGQCPPEVLDGLIGWLNNHGKKKDR